MEEEAEIAKPIHERDARYFDRQYAAFFRKVQEIVQAEIEESRRRAQQAGLSHADLAAIRI